ncbi:MAG: TolC family protein [Acidobacteriales bacterium]|nr:TolC family protein [Terriglobales bacterium]
MNQETKNRTRQWLLRGNLRVALLLITFGAQIHLAKAQNKQFSGAHIQPAMLANAPFSRLKLTLAGAVDLALKQNLDIQIANIETASKQQDRLISRSELLPHVSFDADDAITRYNTKAQLGIQPSIIPHEVGPYQSIHVGPTFSTPIFDLTLIRQYQASGHRLLATRADEQTVHEGTVLLAVSEYMAHLRALASITAAESRVELADRLAHQAQDLLNDGVASKIDVSRAQVRLREEKQVLVDDQRDAETTLYALKRILNVPDGEQVEFADQQNFFSTPSLDVSDPLSTALEQRPELHALSESIKAAESAHKAAVAESMPNLTFEGRWNEQGQTFSTLTPGYEYRFNVRIPIFTGGRLSAERKSTALAEQRTQKQLAQERNLVTEQVRDGQVALQAALHQVELGRQEVQLANEEVSLSQGRFQSGVSDNIEVTTAQDALARANDTEIGALFHYNIARAQLARAIGSVERTYTHP